MSGDVVVALARARCVDVHGDLGYVTACAACHGWAAHLAAVLAPVVAPDPGTLSEAIAEEFCARHQAASPTRQPCAACTQDAKALLAAVPARDDLAAKVEAWDEGYLASDGDPTGDAVNPYRALLADPEPDREQPPSPVAPTPHEASRPSPRPPETPNQRRNQ